MTISERLRDGIAVIELTGGLTLTDGVDLLRERIRGLLHRGHKQIVADLSRVPDMDSAGLGELVKSYVATMRQHGQFKLASAPRHVDALLRVTKLSTVLECYPTQEAALASFAAV